MATVGKKGKAGAEGRGAVPSPTDSKRFKQETKSCTPNALPGYQASAGHKPSATPSTKIPKSKIPKEKRESCCMKSSSSSSQNLKAHSIGLPPAAPSTSNTPSPKSPKSSIFSRLLHRQSSTETDHPKQRSPKSPPEQGTLEPKPSKLRNSAEGRLRLFNRTSSLKEVKIPLPVATKSALPQKLSTSAKPGKEKLLAKSKEATRSRIFQISHSHRKKKQESMLEEAAGASHQVAPQGTPQEDGVSDKKLVANQATDDGDVVMESVPATATKKVTEVLKTTRESVQAWVNSISGHDGAEDLEQQQQQQQRGAAAAELVTMETAPSDEAAATAAKPEDDDLTLGAEAKLMTPQKDVVLSRSTRQRLAEVGAAAGKNRHMSWREMYAQVHHDSFNSEASAHSYNTWDSIDQLLHERTGDPEEILTNLGFHSRDSDDSLPTRIPERFLRQPSIAKGVSLERFIENNPELREYMSLTRSLSEHSHGSLGSDMPDQGFSANGQSSMYRVVRTLALVRQVTSQLSWGQMRWPKWMLSTEDPTTKTQSLHHEGVLPNGKPFTSILHPDNSTFLAKQGIYDELHVVKQPDAIDNNLPPDNRFLTEQGRYDEIKQPDALDNILPPDNNTFVGKQGIYDQVKESAAIDNKQQEHEEHSTTVQLPKLKCSNFLDPNCCNGPVAKSQSVPSSPRQFRCHASRYSIPQRFCRSTPSSPVDVDVPELVFPKVEGKNVGITQEEPRKIAHKWNKILKVSTEQSLRKSTGSLNLPCETGTPCDLLQARSLSQSNISPRFYQQEGSVLANARTTVSLLETTDKVKQVETNGDQHAKVDTSTPSNHTEGLWDDTKMPKRNVDLIACQKRSASFMDDAKENTASEEPSIVVEESPVKRPRRKLANVCVLSDQRKVLEALDTHVGLTERVDTAEGISDSNGAAMPLPASDSIYVDDSIVLSLTNHNSGDTAYQIHPLLGDHGNVIDKSHAEKTDKMDKNRMLYLSNDALSSEQINENMTYGLCDSPKGIPLGYPDGVETLMDWEEGKANDTYQKPPQFFDIPDKGEGLLKCGEAAADQFSDHSGELDDVFAEVEVGTARMVAVKASRVKLSENPHAHLLGEVSEAIGKRPSQGLNKNRKDLIPDLPDDWVCQTLQNGLSNEQENLGDSVQEIHNCPEINDAGNQGQPAGDLRVEVVLGANCSHDLVRVLEDQVERLKEEIVWEESNLNPELESIRHSLVDEDNEIAQFGIDISQSNQPEYKEHSINLTSETVDDCFPHNMRTKHSMGNNQFAGQFSESESKFPVVKNHSPSQGGSPDASLYLNSGDDVYFDPRYDPPSLAYLSEGAISLDTLDSPASSNPTRDVSLDHSVSQTQPQVGSFDDLVDVSLDTGAEFEPGEPSITGKRRTFSRQESIGHSKDSTGSSQESRGSLGQGPGKDIPCEEGRGAKPAIESSSHTETRVYHEIADNVQECVVQEAPGETERLEGWEMVTGQEGSCDVQEMQRLRTMSLVRFTESDPDVSVHRERDAETMQVFHEDLIDDNVHDRSLQEDVYLTDLYLQLQRNAQHRDPRVTLRHQEANTSLRQTQSIQDDRVSYDGRMTSEIPQQMTDISHANGMNNTLPEQWDQMVGMPIDHAQSSSAVDSLSCQGVNGVSKDDGPLQESAHNGSQQKVLVPLQSFDLEEVASSDLVMDELPRFQGQQEWHHSGKRPFVRSGSVQSDSSGFADTDTMETLRSGDLEQVLKVRPLERRQDITDLTRTDQDLQQNLQRDSLQQDKQDLQQDSLQDLQQGLQPEHATAATMGATVSLADSLSSGKPGSEDLKKTGVPSPEVREEKEWNVVENGKEITHRDFLFGVPQILPGDETPRTKKTSTNRRSRGQKPKPDQTSAIQASQGERKTSLNWISRLYVDPPQRPEICPNSAVQVNLLIDQGEIKEIENARTVVADTGVPGEPVVDRPARKVSFLHLCVSQQGSELEFRPIDKGDYLLPSVHRDCAQHQMLCSILKQPTEAWTPGPETLHHQQVWSVAAISHRNQRHQHLLEEVKLIQHALHKFKVEFSSLGLHANELYKRDPASLTEEQIQELDELKTLRTAVATEVAELEHTLAAKMQTMMTSVDERSVTDLAGLNIIHEMIHLLKEQVFHSNVIGTLRLSAVPATECPLVTERGSSSSAADHQSAPGGVLVAGDPFISLQQQLAEHQAQTTTQLTLAFKELRDALLTEVRQTVQEETQELRKQVQAAESQVSLLMKILQDKDTTEGHRVTRSTPDTADPSKS